MEKAMKRGILVTLIFMFVGAVTSSIMVGCAETTTASRSGVSNPNYWDKKKGDCDTVLMMPYAYDLSQVSRCTKLWEMYRYVDELPLKERSKYAVAFSQVSYSASDPYDKAIADAALKRICIPRHPLDGNGNVKEVIPDSLECDAVSNVSIGGQGVVSSNPYARSRRQVTVSEPSASQTKAATSAYKKATKTRKTSASKAIPLYREALEADPYYVAAKYDLACALAVVEDDRAALKELEDLYTWDDDEAEQRLVKARTDEDFTYLREDPNFKLLTGYVNIAIINGAGSIGMQTVANMKKKLEAKNYSVSTVGKSNRPELVPVIWYREGFEDYANKIKEALGQRKMAVKLLAKPSTSNDILVVWGQPEAASIGVGQNAPVVQGQRAQGSENKLDDMLNQVDQATSTVDHAKAAREKVTSIGSGF